MTIKKISIDQLEPGMYVHDLNWSANSGHLTNGHFPILDERQILSLRKMGARELYIDSVLGNDVVEALTLNDVRSRLEAQLLEIGQGAGSSSPREINEEVEVAKGIHDYAATYIGNLMHQVRRGKIEEVGNQLLDLAQDMTRSLARNPHALISLAKVRSKDNYTFLHCTGSAILMGAFCRTLQLSSEIGRHLVIGALLHDVGKMRVPDEILNKPGRLMPEEFEIMRQHVQFGEEALFDLPLLSEISLTVASQHHERLDGTGYPRGLSSLEISPFGQMAAIVDVYDALSSARVYHAAMEPVEVILKLLEWSGQHLNKELVQHFIRTVGVFPAGTLVRLESGRLAAVLGQGKGGGNKPMVRMVYDTLARHEIKQHDVDLSDASDDDKIVAWEPWEKWDFDPATFGLGSSAR